MVKGEDAIRKKRNKAARKRLNRDPSTVSARVAAIIATKKRRKAGHRRICEGMCYSLPTLDDPFNDRYSKKDLNKKEDTRLVPSRADGKTSGQRKVAQGRNTSKVNRNESEGEKIINFEGSENAKIQHPEEGSSCPAKFLIMCLNTIQNALRHDGILDSEEDRPRPFFVNMWGVELLKCCTVGRDILATSESCSTVEQIAWMVSTAADSMTRKEKEGLSLSNPFLLYLVPTQEKASEVRSICKPLKNLGIHTVSLHPGATIDRQIHGLKSCEPEFLVSTPERLLELVSLKALDLSGVAFLVVDGLEAACKGGHLDATKSIRKLIPGNPITMVFNDYLNCTSVRAVQNLLTGSISRLSLNDYACQSACIIQSVDVCASEEEKLLKGIQALSQVCGNRNSRQLMKVLCVVWKDGKFQKLVSAIKSKGYPVSKDSTICDTTGIENRKAKPAVSVIDMKHVDTIDLGKYEFVIILDFPPSNESYVQILTRMARHTVNGVLHSIITKEDAPHAEPLIQILEQCGQVVPEALRNLCPTSPMLEQ